jgi:hypothetical protein
VGAATSWHQAEWRIPVSNPWYAFIHNLVDHGFNLVDNTLAAGN